jgi:hypothetical protein
MPALTVMALSMPTVKENITGKWFLLSEMTGAVCKKKPYKQSTIN